MSGQRQAPPLLACRPHPHAQCYPPLHIMLIICPPACRGSEVTFVTPSEDPIRRTLELATALAVGLQDAAAAARAQEPALTAQAQQAIEEGAATLAGQVCGIQ